VWLCEPWVHGCSSTHIDLIWLKILDPMLCYATRSPKPFVLTTEGGGVYARQNNNSIGSKIVFVFAVSNELGGDVNTCLLAVGADKALKHILLVL